MFRKLKSTLETSGEDVKLHSKRVEKLGKSIYEAHIGTATKEGTFRSFIDQGRQSSPLGTSVFSHLFHSERVFFHIFPTRNECSFTCSPLETSVVFSSFPLETSVVFSSFPLETGVVFSSFPLETSVVFRDFEAHKKSKFLGY